jgi:hypothetical protein
VANASRTEAEDKAALIAQLPLEVDAPLLLSDALNFGFAGKGLDEAFTDEAMAGISGLMRSATGRCSAPARRVRWCATSWWPAAGAGHAWTWRATL